MSFSFSAHRDLLDYFLTRRRAIAERIENTLLNVRGKPLLRNRDRAYFDRLLHACFFGLPNLPAAFSPLRGQLHAAHLAEGFEPVQADRYANELDPLELIVRGYEYWEAHRWPGFTGRVAYAQTIFAVFMVRQLEWLSLRIWDEGNDRAGECLDRVQQLLDRLNDSAIPSCVFIRHSHWLMQTAQGPLTRHLHAYFEVAGRMAGSLTHDQRVEIQKAGARLAGGHLRSQLQYRVWTTGRPADDPENLAFIRNSNAMDGALLIRDLVGLLEAYTVARDTGQHEQRLDLADAILQGLSADPELFLVRLDLLGPCTFIEALFLESDAEQGHRYTSLGLVHWEYVIRYQTLIGSLAGSLQSDATELNPAERVYSPHGITYGFCADVLSNMAADALVSQPSLGLGLEDMFVSRDNLEPKRARAEGWARLPRRAGERAHFDYSAENAAHRVARMMSALDVRRLRGNELNASNVRSACLCIESGSAASGLPLGSTAMLADEFCFTTDPKGAASRGRTLWPGAQLLSDRNEGRYLASAECDGGWIGVSKVILTLILGQGRDAVITDMPRALGQILRLTCPGLVESPGTSATENSRLLAPASTETDTRDRTPTT